MVDYQKLKPDILNFLVEKFPDGYDDNHIIAFRNAKNEVIDAVEVKTEIALSYYNCKLHNPMRVYWHYPTFCCPLF